MKTILTVLLSVIIYILGEWAFSAIAGKESNFAIYLAPAAALFIYAMGYYYIASEFPHAKGPYGFLVGGFMIFAMLFHSVTINIFLDGLAAWKVIAAIVGGTTLFSTFWLIPGLQKITEE